MLDIFNQMESEIIPERGESIHKAADDPFRPWFLIGPASVPWRYRFVKKEREKKKKTCPDRTIGEIFILLR